MTVSQRQTSQETLPCFTFKLLKIFQHHGNTNNNLISETNCLMHNVEYGCVTCLFHKYNSNPCKTSLFSFSVKTFINFKFYGLITGQNNVFQSYFFFLKILKNISDVIFLKSDLSDILNHLSKFVINYLLTKFVKQEFLSSVQLSQ
jgi:hypothetical protein